MFWHKIKDLTNERDYLRDARDEALSRLDAKSRECERLIASTKIAIDESAKDRRLAQEEEANAAACQASLETCQASLEKYEGQLCVVVERMDSVRAFAASYMPIDVDSKRLKATLSTKLREAQSIIARVEIKTLPLP